MAGTGTSWVGPEAVYKLQLLIPPPTKILPLQGSTPIQKKGRSNKGRSWCKDEDLCCEWFQSQPFPHLPSVRASSIHHLGHMSWAYLSSCRTKTPLARPELTWESWLLIYRRGNDSWSCKSQGTQFCPSVYQVDGIFDWAARLEQMPCPSHMQIDYNVELMKTLIGSGGAAQGKVWAVSVVVSQHAGTRAGSQLYFWR